MIPVSFQSTWSALGSAVVHFLWQGALIGALAAAVLWGMRGRSPAARYAVAAGAMLLCFASFAVTLGLTLMVPAHADSPLPALEGVGLGGASSPGAVQIAAWCWAVGVVVMATRFALQCYGVRRLKTTGVSEPEPEWGRAFEELKRGLGITRGVRLLRSGLAEVPMVVGWLSPIVLVPVAAFTALSPDQLRSLLAHELTHIRRHDHLINAAQAVVEIVLFFHPVVWWLSKQMRDEREYCCDDSSVRLMGDPKLIAEALAALEALRIQPTTIQPTTTVLASNGGPLMQRITRILGVSQDDRSYRTGWQLPAGLLLAGFVTLAGNAYARPSADEGQEPRSAKTEEHVRKQQEADKRAVEQERRAREVELKRRYEAVSADLEAAVKAGQLSKEEANKKLVELREEFRRSTEVPVRRRTSKQSYAAYEKKAEAIRAALEAGKISETDAEKKLLELRAAIQKQQDAENVVSRIQSAIESGKMTPEEGQERLEAYEVRLAQLRAQEQELRLVNELQRVDLAVSKGEMTKEEAREHIAALKASMAPEVTTERFLGTKQLPAGREVPRADLSRVADMQERIDRAVAAGQMTPEEAAQAMKKLEVHSGSPRRTPMNREDYERAIEKVEAAVAAGKLSEAEAKKLLIEMRDAVEAERRAVSEQDVRRQLEAAVKAGQLTAEEAAEKLEAYRESMAIKEKQAKLEKLEAQKKHQRR